MNTRWQRAKELFAEACEREPEQRDSFLAEACQGDEELKREVVSLLESYQQTHAIFDSPVGAEIGATAAAAPARNDPMAGRTIGSYRIIRQIGRGGMGSVYLGERADDEFRRRVAIKAVNAELVDTEILRRFHNERQTLAVLDHPNIVKLLDGGTTESGAPYLVMDYVEGQPIDEYCDAHNLTTTERLQLFRTVCSAVHYAHQNLVVHRDLKPGNILITPEGVPKLLDFGIAKLLKPEYSTTIAVTKTDARPMTPDYASPEQFLGQPVTTASDVYSLGVMLYRLLTGSHPYQAKTQSAAELYWAICKADPERPSTFVTHVEKQKTAVAPPVERRGENLARRLKGDLDMIVLMAMRKEPQRRYASVEHLSEDIRRHLEGLPVIARKDTWRYRGYKFIARNRAAVGASAAVVLALIASTVIARREQAIAEKRFQDLRQFANFTLNDLDAALRAGPTPARKTLVGKGLEYLDRLAGEARNDPSIQHDLINGYIKMGDVDGNLYVANLGESSGAEQSYRKALAIAEALLRSRPKDPEALRAVAATNVKLGDLLGPNGRKKEALDKYAEARKVYEGLLAPQPSNPEYLGGLTRVWDKIGSTYEQMWDDARALESYRRFAEIARSWFAVDPSKARILAYARERVAYFAALNGDTAGAEESIQDALRTYQSSPHPPPRLIAQVYATMAEVQKRTGKLPEALESARKSLKITEDLLQKDPQNRQYQIDLPQSLVLYIDLLMRSGKKGEARKQTERALSFLKLQVQAGDASVQQMDYVLLLVTTPFADLRDDATALRWARKAVDTTQQSDPEAMDYLAQALARSNDFTNAAAVEGKALGLLPTADPVRGSSVLRRTIEGHLASYQASLRPVAGSAPH